jgi:hypothetical protein
VYWICPDTVVVELSLGLSSAMAPDDGLAWAVRLGDTIVCTVAPPPRRALIRSWYATGPRAERSRLSKAT